MTKKARGFENNSSPGCAPTLVILRLKQRYVVLVLRVVVPGGCSSGGRESRCRAGAAAAAARPPARPARRQGGQRLMRASSSICSEESRRWRRTSSPPQGYTRRDRRTGISSNQTPRQAVETCSGILHVESWRRRDGGAQCHPTGGPEGEQPAKNDAR